MAGRSSLENQVQASHLQEDLGQPMEPPVVLGPKPLRLDPLAVVVLGIAAGLMITTLRLALASDGIFVAAYGVATAALATGPAAFLLLRRSQRSLFALFERGLLLEIRSRKWTFPLHHLRTLELRERDVSGGLLRCITLTGRQTRVQFEHFAPPGREDRLGAVLVRLLARLAEIAERKLEVGGSVLGRDWVLRPEGLAAPAHEHPLPFAEIGGVTVRRGKVAIWKPHERFPFFVVPAHSENALVLVAFLSRRLEERGEILPQRWT